MKRFFKYNFNLIFKFKYRHVNGKNKVKLMLKLHRNIAKSKEFGTFYNLLLKLITLDCVFIPSNPHFNILFVIIIYILYRTSFFGKSGIFGLSR